MKVSTASTNINAKQVSSTAGIVVGMVVTQSGGDGAGWAKFCCRKCC